LQALLKESVPSYNLLSKLLLKHNSHSSFLSKLLPTITLTNTSSITRIKQTKHIKDKAEAITKAEVSKEASEATVALKAVAVSKETETITNISYYLYVRRSVIFITSQVANQ
jgi:hypothetical protein